MLFVMKINDMPDTVENYIRLFGDDAKLFANVDTDKDHRLLQEDLNRLQEWSDKWLLKFNAKKCT
jgi:hypothetical protein